jgi:phospholipid-transporting ATPase
MLNSSKKPTKASNVTGIKNENILYLFVMLVTVGIFCSIGSFAISVSIILYCKENKK